MQGVLAKLATLLGPIFLDWLLKKWNAWRSAQEAKKKSEADNKQVRDQTEAANTPEERENALKNELRNS